MHHIEIVSQLDGQHLAQLPRLIEAATVADGHEPLGEHKFLRLRRGDDLAVALLAYEDGRLIGYAHTLTFDDGERRRVSCEFVVHPGERRRGIGRSLVARALEHAGQERAQRIDVWAYNDSAASASVACQFGFRPARRLLHLHRHVSALPDSRAAGGGHIRPFVPGADDERWLALNNRIFAGHPENGCWALDDLHARMEQRWFNADDFLLLEVDSELAGFCWLKVQERGAEGRVGEIYVIGTAPEHRGRGLGLYLVSQALRRLRERDARVAAIYVDESNRAAVQLYERSGFHYHHVDVCYSRELAGETAGAGDEAAA